MTLSRPVRGPLAATYDAYDYDSRADYDPAFASLGDDAAVYDPALESYNLVVAAYCDSRAALAAANASLAVALASRDRARAVWLAACDAYDDARAYGDARAANATAKAKGDLR